MINQNNYQNKAIHSDIDPLRKMANKCMDTLARNKKNEVVVKKVAEVLGVPNLLEDKKT